MNHSIEKLTPSGLNQIPTLSFGGVGFQKPDDIGNIEYLANISSDEKLTANKLTALNLLKINSTDAVLPVLLTPIFVMRVIDQPFVDGTFSIKLLAFRRKPGSFVRPNGEIYNAYMFRDLSSYDNNHLNAGSGPANQQRPAILNGTGYNYSNDSRNGNEP